MMMGSGRVHEFGALVQSVTTFALVLVVLLCIALVAKDVDSPNFWFDEAGQYWLSAGQGHYSAAGTQDGTLADVWRHSQGGNSDPGGFTLVLRMISKWGGTTPTVLRMAPLSFGVAALLLLIYWSHLLGLPPALSLAAPLILLNNLDFLYFMLELRAYSMEFCGVLALFLATVLLVSRSRLLFLALWMVSVGFFSLSRYPFLIYVGTACILLMIVAARRRGRDCGLLYIAVGTALLTYLAIYLGMLQFQSILHGHPFIAKYTLAGKSWAEIGEIVSRNFFSRFMWPKTVLLLLLSAEMLRRRRSGLVVTNGSKSNPIFLLGGFIIIADFSSAFLSSLGRLPWDVGDHRWSLSQYALSALAFPGVVAILFTWSEIWYPRFIKWLPQSIASASAIIAFIWALSTTLGLAAYHRDFWEQEQSYPTLIRMSEYGGLGGSIVLDRGMWPSYRYIVERSQQRLPRGFESMVLEVMDFSDLSAVAAKGSGLPRPVHFVFGTWDRKLKDQLHTKLAPYGSVNSTFIDAHDFTNLVVLLPTSKDQ